MNEIRELRSQCQISDLEGEREQSSPDNTSCSNKESKEPEDEAQMKSVYMDTELEKTMVEKPSHPVNSSWRDNSARNKYPLSLHSTDNRSQQMLGETTYKRMV